MKYFKIRSWHTYVFESRGGQPKARCGKWGVQGAPLQTELPLTEPSCESCLRLITHDAGKGR